MTTRAVYQFVLSSLILIWRTEFWPYQNKVSEETAEKTREHLVLYSAVKASRFFA